MTWFSIIISGIVTYFSRMAMVALIDREMLGTKVKEVLNYVPAAVFPAIIFPGVFFNDFGTSYCFSYLLVGSWSCVFENAFGIRNCVCLKPFGIRDWVCLNPIVKRDWD